MTVSVVLTVAPCRICISPQCGFASHSEGNNIDEDAMRAKLKLVSDTAKKIWSDA